MTAPLVHEINPAYQGKVRDIYDLGDQLLLVASDRISAFDYILPDTIDHKGEVLTRLSAFWFNFFADEVKHHMVSLDLSELPEEFAPHRSHFEGRSMITQQAKPFAFECIVRGYLTGSGKASYDKTGEVCGIVLPEGLVEASKLDEPLFTPSTKAAVGDHDENVSFDEMVARIGAEDAMRLRDLSIKLYSKARDYAQERGIIIADTKFEFGVIDGEICLIDEALTPDSSRFWPAASYEPGVVQPSFDKQYVRDWLKQNWDMQGDPPRLPQEVIAVTSQKYIQAYEMITGQLFGKE